jgi:Tol biopolymer transport system component/ABC-type branched-subunit amino acid transport system substrate-binding protein
VSRLRLCFALLGFVLVVVAAAGETAVGASPQAVQAHVVIPPGQPLQIAVAVDDTGLGAFFGPSVREAVQMAIERHPTIRGFPIKVNAFNAPCDNGSPASLADNTTAANAVVGNSQTVAVLGQTCSPESTAWLPVYQAAGLVTINGSTTGPVAALGPTVFNGTAVPDPDFTPWYAAVKALPSDLRWRSSFQARFGSPPSDFADLYYDAANVLLTAIEETATIDDGSLVIDPQALATTVRHTSGLPGATCSITLDPATGYRIDDPAALARCAGGSSEIVFASDRANSNPGEIYVLAAGRTPVDVSNSPAADAGAAVRPDGKLVAFWSDRTGKLRLYVSRPDGSRPRELPEPEPSANVYGAPLVFSPDGSRLLAAIGGNNQCKLFVVDVRTLRAGQVADSCGGASWSPDGSLIVAPVGGHGRQVVVDTAGKHRFSVPGIRALWSARGQLAVVNSANTATVVVDEHGSLLARLPEVAADWSPDGSKLVLTRPGAILLADSPSLRKPRVLVHGPKDWTPFGVGFTPDGAFVHYPRPSGALVAIPVTGGTPRVLPGSGVWSRTGRYAFTRPLPPTLEGGVPRLEVEIGDRFGRHARQAGQFTADDHGAETLTWSADGSRLIFESSVRASRDLWAVDPDGSNLHRLTQGGPDVSAPAWSADGMHLAYTSATYRGGLCDFCQTSVVIAGSDGRVRSTIVDASWDADPSWSPYGTRLVVSVCCSGGLDVVGDDDSGPRPLAPGPAGDVAGAGVWSPDDASIAYVGREGIEVIAPDGSGQRLLLAATGAQSPTALAWSHDGKLLAYSAPDGVHVLTVDGSAPTRLLVAERAPGGLSFSPDDSQIVYAARRPGPDATGQSDLFVISLLGGPARALAPSPYNDSDPAWQPLPSS